MNQRTRSILIHAAQIQQPRRGDGERLRRTIARFIALQQQIPSRCDLTVHAEMADSPSASSRFV